MNSSRRQQRVAQLIKEKLSSLLIAEVEPSFSCLLTITRIEITSDLKTANIYLSLYGSENKEAILAELLRRTGHFRRYIASEINLKYNPLLFFFWDPVPDYEARLDSLIEKTKKK
jgi:ribosome-binding factor A